MKTDKIMLFKCEWCRMTYPYGGWDYYQYIAGDEGHIICPICYQNLKPVTVEMQLDAIRKIADKGRRTTNANIKI